MLAPTKQKAKVNLCDCVNDVFQPLIGNQSRFLVLYGGAGSGKSVFSAQKVIMRTLTEEPHTMICLRKVANWLRGSVFAMLIGVISQWGLADHFKVNQGAMTITCLDNGNQILCLGLDDPEKIKSITGAGGLGITGFWLEEPTELTPYDFMQLDLRLRGQLPNYKQIILSFNPISHLHWLKGRFFDSESADTTISKTTYLDNRFIDDEYEARLNATRDLDESYYQIYALGNWGILKGIIYKPFKCIAKYPIEFDEILHGLDFGFNHPTALVGIGLKDGDAYLDEEIYETGKTNSDLIKMMGELGISKRDPIYADSAEPDRILEIKRAGYNIHPADKGQGSVIAGIDFCKSMKIYTRSNNVNINNENGSYKYREDKDGNVLEEPAKLNDDAMDAMRYGLFSHIRKPKPLKPFSRSEMGI